jgi:hypothetical protein
MSSRLPRLQRAIFYRPSRRNNIRRGYNRREIIDHIDELRFRSQNEKHAVAPV